MQEDPELDRVIVTNLADLDAAAKVVGEIEVRVWAAMAEQIEQWAQSKGWPGSFDPNNCWVTAPGWNHGDDDVSGWFSVRYGPDDSSASNYFDLSRFAGVGGGRICLWFSVETVVKRTVWRRAFRAAAERGDSAGFAFDENGGLYFDCTPPAGSLPHAVATKDYKLAFGPLQYALESAYSGWSALDRLLEEVRGSGTVIPSS